MLNETILFEDLLYLDFDVKISTRKQDVSAKITKLMVKLWTWLCNCATVREPVCMVLHSPSNTLIQRSLCLSIPSSLVHPPLLLQEPVEHRPDIVMGPWSLEPWALRCLLSVLFLSCPHPGSRFLCPLPSSTVPFLALPFPHPLGLAQNVCSFLSSELQ